MTVDTLFKSMELYAFLDIATNPPNFDTIGFPKVDLLAHLQSIKTKNFSNDWNFQLQLRSKFLQLHDAHTNYYPPANYGAFSWYQPFGLISVLENNQQNIYISPYYRQSVYDYYKNRNIDLKQFHGARITKIDSMDALEYLKLFSRFDVSSVKDPATRFNVALNMPYLLIFYLLQTIKMLYMKFYFQTKQPAHIHFDGLQEPASILPIQKIL